MFGNLICLSPSGKFDDPLWATVSERNDELLEKHQIIELELVSEFNPLSTSEAISTLQMSAGSTVMVESPIYFRSKQPVLKALQSFKIEIFTLKEEIVDCKFIQQRPNYLTEETTAEMGFLIQSNRVKDLIEEKYGTLLSVNKKLSAVLKHSSFDSSQQAAMISCFRNRLAIIQGPPGCGKTFIGLKFVELLMSFTPPPKFPILVLTYKNHALDEFLKSSLEFTTDIVRIGGRSKEPILTGYNLNELKKERVNRYFDERLLEIRNERAELEDDLKEKVKSLQESGVLICEDVLECLTEEQLIGFIKDAPYGQGPRKVVLKLDGKKFADRNLVAKEVDNILKKYGSLSTFWKVDSKTLTKAEKNLKDSFRRILDIWRPEDELMSVMKAMFHDYLSAIKDNNNNGDVDLEEEEDDEEFDEQALEAIQEARMAPYSANNRNKEQPKLILFDDKNIAPKNIVTCIQKFPSKMEASSSLLLTKSLWNLNDGQRILFLFTILQNKTSGVFSRVQPIIDRLEELNKLEANIQSEHEANILRSKKIIGMTITGASINNKLIKQVSPAIVVVEEAAEVLEADLLAALPENIQHLVLIGDHKQLRPQVDTYKLRTKYNFDLSLMERMIHNNYPYVMLENQNRMRPEFSNLLKDIYPNLKDNLNVVDKNVPLSCVGKSMFFWTHSVEEKSGRSVTNPEEADRVVAITKYLLLNNIAPTDITILAAYQGQVAVIRKKVNQLRLEWASPAEEEFEGKSIIAAQNFVNVNTIDMFQGDENKYIIVSLVRSNSRGKIGFLKEINRRCVAQSRAKCGLYFTGDKGTLMSPGSPWSVMIKQMEEENCAADKLPLSCKKHDQTLGVTDSKSLCSVMKDFTKLCNYECGEVYECKLHKCKRNCVPEHVHTKCMEKVNFIFEDCGHSATKLCHQKASDLACKSKCGKLMNCGLHKCSKVCSSNHDHRKCFEIVDFKYPKCGHADKKGCSVDVGQLKCRTPVLFKYPKCGHSKYFECHEATKYESGATESPKCKVEIPFQFSFCKHSSSKKCHEDERNLQCQQKVTYTFPVCKHPSPMKKKCSEPITWLCKYELYKRGGCGHDIKVLCHQDVSTVTCTFTPCSRPRSCGHPCTNRCGESCDAGDCRRCEQEREIQVQKMKARARQRIKQLEDRIREEGSGPRFDDVPPSSPEYMKVFDKVMKYIVPMHNWSPHITKIEKITNHKLEQEYQKFKTEAFGEFEDEKFHGTGKEGIEGIPKTGFRIGSEAGMYGKGVYFATDSSKSSQLIYTKGSNKLLLCKVLLGKEKKLLKADKTYDKAKICRERCDSVFAPRDTKSSGGVANDEFVIFDTRQAVPIYVIHYTNGTGGGVSLPATVPTGGFSKVNMTPTRAVNIADPNEVLYRLYESNFYRHQGLGPIQSMDLVSNPKLEAAFNKKKTEFKTKKIPNKVIFAYHGTSFSVIDTIIRSNFDMSFARRQAHGPGNYFSEFPNTALGYASGARRLIFCKILPGKEYKGSDNSWPGFDSKLVTPNQQDVSQMVIIQNKDQILPIAVINL